MPPLVLGIAIVLEALSFRTAILETNKIKGGASFPQFIRRAKQPELPVILLEDLAALVGLVFAFVAVVLSLVTENLYCDVAGTALIGLLLVAVAVVLGHRDQEPAARRVGQRPGAARGSPTALEGTPGVERIIHMKTMHLGPEELLVAAKIGVPTAGATADQVADAIDAAEEAVRAAEPTAQVIYLEPDIYRADYVPAERPRAPGPRGALSPECGTRSGSCGRSSRILGLTGAVLISQAQPEPHPDTGGSRWTTRSPTSAWPTSAAPRSSSPSTRCPA